MLFPIKNAPFPADKQGGVAIVFGFCLAIISASVGLGLDVGRQRLAQSITKTAMDAAVLAGASHLQLHPTDTTGAIAAATIYYNSGVTSRATLATDTIQFVTADNNTAITATGTATISSPFMTIFGVSQLPVIDGTAGSFSKAIVPSGAAAGSNYELAVMLDVTGSMCDDGVGPCTTGSAHARRVPNSTASKSRSKT